MTFSALSKRVRVNVLRTTLSCVVSVAGVDECRNQFLALYVRTSSTPGSVVVRNSSITGQEITK